MFIATVTVRIFFIKLRLKPTGVPVPLFWPVTCSASLGWRDHRLSGPNLPQTAEDVSVFA